MFDLSERSTQIAIRSSQKFAIGAIPRWNNLHPHTTTASSLVALRGGGGMDGSHHLPDPDTLFNAWEWCANLGAPAALIAGAVLATFMEHNKEKNIKSDANWVIWAKTGVQLLLLSSFALEIVSIFVTTITGTMLLTYGDGQSIPGKGPHPLGRDNKFASPLGLMEDQFAYEYITSRVTFLQGLLNWLAAIALDQLVPRDGQTVTRTKMNYFISSFILSMMIFMLSFYNEHMTFYTSYGHLCWEFLIETFRRFFCGWPPRPLIMLGIPLFMMTLKLGFDVLWTLSEKEEPNKD